MMASKARLFIDETSISAIFASDDLREQKRLGRLICHYVFRVNLAKFSQTERMSVVLKPTSDRHIVEASPHHQVWGIGFNTSDLRATSHTSWYRPNFLDQTLQRTREMPRQSTSGNTLAPRDDNTDTSFEDDLITQLRLNNTPLNTATHVAQLLAFTDWVLNNHAHDVLLHYSPARPCLLCLKRPRPGQRRRNSRRCHFHNPHFSTELSFCDISVRLPHPS